MQYQHPGIWRTVPPQGFHHEGYILWGWENVPGYVYYMALTGVELHVPSEFPFLEDV